MDVGSDVREWFWGMTDRPTELFKFEDAVIDVVAVVHRNVAVDWLRAPEVWRNIDDKSTGTGAQGWDRIRIRVVVRVVLVVVVRMVMNGQARWKRKLGSRVSGGGMHSALEVAQRHVVRCCGKNGAGRNNRCAGGCGEKPTSTSMIAGR